MLYILIAISPIVPLFLGLYPRPMDHVEGNGIAAHVGQTRGSAFIRHGADHLMLYMLYLGAGE